MRISCIVLLVSLGSAVLVGCENGYDQGLPSGTGVNESPGTTGGADEDADATAPGFGQPAPGGGTDLTPMPPAGGAGTNPAEPGAGGATAPEETTDGGAGIDQPAGAPQPVEE